MKANAVKCHTVLDGNRIAPLFSGTNSYDRCIFNENALRESHKKNQMLIASYGDEFKELLDYLC